MFAVVNVISFSPLDQQLLRFSPLLDHVTEMMCHLFDFEEGNFKSGFGIELLPSFTMAPACAFEINRPRPPTVL